MSSHEQPNQPQSDSAQGSVPAGALIDALPRRAVLVRARSSASNGED